MAPIDDVGYGADIFSWHLFRRYNDESDSPTRFSEHKRSIVESGGTLKPFMSAEFSRIFGEL